MTNGGQELKTNYKILIKLPYAGSLSTTGRQTNLKVTFN